MRSIKLFFLDMPIEVKAVQAKNNLLIEIRGEHYCVTRTPRQHETILVKLSDVSRKTSEPSAPKGQSHKLLNKRTNTQASRSITKCN